MEPTADTPVHLFVYGTLRSDVGGPVQARLMRGVRRLGPAFIRAVMYDTGPYPVAVASDGPADRVRGELCGFDARAADALLAALDAYEGIDAAHPALSLFRRQVVAAEREDGTRVPAWVYLYNGPVDSLPRVTSGDWLRRGPG